MKTPSSPLRNTRTPPGWRVALWAGLALPLATLLAGCATGGAASAKRAAAQAPDSQAQWGIEVTSMRLSGGGRLIDFRYRVLDPIKAAALADPANQPVLIDQATGARLHVPNMPKIGPLRQTAAQLESGKIYFALFANDGLVVKSGSVVSVEIGDFKSAPMPVE